MNKISCLNLQNIMITKPEFADALKGERKKPKVEANFNKRVL